MFKLGKEDIKSEFPGSGGDSDEHHKPGKEGEGWEGEGGGGEP